MGKTLLGNYEVTTKLKYAICNYLMSEFQHSDYTITDGRYIAVAYTEKEIDEVEHLISDEDIQAIKDGGYECQIPFEVDFDLATFQVRLIIDDQVIKYDDLETESGAIEYFDSLDFDGAICFW